MVTASSFAYEADLCRTLTRELLSKMASDEIRVVRHLQVATEIPDYVLVHSGEAQSVAPRLSSMECAVLAQLHWGETARDAIADHLFSQPWRIEAALTRLVRLGLATVVGTAYASATEVLRHARVIAIEAKLTRWADALDQARSYRRFANASYVALPLDVLRRRREHFRRDCETAQIGLLGVAPDSCCIDVPAPHHNPLTIDWVLTVMRSLAANVSEKRRIAGTQSTSCVDGSGLFAR